MNNDDLKTIKAAQQLTGGHRIGPLSLFSNVLLRATRAGIMTNAEVNNLWCKWVALSSAERHQIFIKISELE